MPFEQKTFKSPLARLVAYIASVLSMVAAVIFSLFLLTVAAVVGFGAWAGFWWRKRKQRRSPDGQGRNGVHTNIPGRFAKSRVDDGDIIEGEATRIADEHDAEHTSSS